jgi:hypothetical protein
MSSVTPKRVLPHWAIEELGQAAEDFDLEIAVRPLGGNCPRMLIGVSHECGDFQFVVYMRYDWEDLCKLGEGDLWGLVIEMHLECINE